MSLCYLLSFSSPRRVTQLLLTSLILIFSSELGILKKNKFPEKILRGKFLLETINSLYHILLYKNLDFVLWTIILTRGFFFVMNILMRLYRNPVRTYILLNEIKYLLYLEFSPSYTCFVEMKSILCLNLKLLRYLQRFSPMFFMFTFW